MDSNKVQKVFFRINANSSQYTAMIVYYKMTELSNKLKFYTAKFGFLEGGTLRCIWNIRFILMKPMLPENFFENYALNVSCTVRLYSILGIMEEGKFYNNLKFDGGEIESECAIELFVSKETVGMPKSQFDAVKVPELTPAVR